MPSTYFLRNRQLQPTLIQRLGRLSINDRDRLAKHKEALATMGVETITGLGKLRIRSTVTPSTGMVLPNRRGVISTDTVRFRNAYRREAASGAITRIHGQAHLLKAKPFPLQRLPNGTMQLGRRTLPVTASTILPIDTAYWVAEEIHIEDNTTVVFAGHQRHLVIIAKRVTIGQQVTFSWAREPLEQPAPPPKADDGETGHQSRQLHGQDAKGDDGDRNTNPATTGHCGKDGPQLEIWTLDLTGSATFDLAGQDGGQGANGGAGGDGGQGGEGRPARKRRVLAAWVCSSGPGTGGSGGDGGRGGRGGTGGCGGDGGSLKIYAPQAVLQTLGATGLYADCAPGRGGRGGAGGKGGAAGRGGRRGAYRRDSLGNRCTGDHAHSGNPGVPGADGELGTDGQNGSRNAHALRLVGISTDLFNQELQKPAIHTLTQHSGVVGDTVTLHGRNFSRNDTVHFNGTACPTTYSSTTSLTFTVPDSEGGEAVIEVVQGDGTISNKISFLLLPVLQDAQDWEGKRLSQGAKFYPGTEVTLLGTGFNEDIAIQFGGHFMDANAVTYISKNELRVSAQRPAGIDAEETVEVTATLDTGEASNTLQLSLWTYEVVCLGDSIVWGQGLRDEHKFTAIVEEHLKEVSNDRIGIKRAVFARSGAIIGDQLATTFQAGHPNGEVPDSSPTIRQQIQQFRRTGGDPRAVRLVLLDGGINDVNVRRILGGEDIRGDIEEFCYRRMSALLAEVRTEFPNAKIIVSGYFKIVSRESSRAMLSLYLLATGAAGAVSAAVAAGGVVGIAAGVALSVAAHDHLVDRSRILHRQAHKQLRRAIDEFNAEAGTATAYFADPGFSDANAIFAPEAMLWGVKGDLTLSPADEEAIGGVAEDRTVFCANAGLGEMREFICVRASAGHPNVEGAAKYAQAIIGIWDDQINDLDSPTSNA